MSDDPTCQFVDTNILVYAHDKSAEQKHQQAKTLVQSLDIIGNKAIAS